jgi:hypothetical protein
MGGGVRFGGMKDWKDERLEGWKIGRMEGWKDGRMEGWKDGSSVSGYVNE